MCNCNYEYIILLKQKKTSNNHNKCATPRRPPVPNVYSEFQIYTSNCSRRIVQCYLTMIKIILQTYKIIYLAKFIYFRDELFVTRSFVFLVRKLDALAFFFSHVFVVPSPNCIFMGMGSMSMSMVFAVWMGTVSCSQYSLFDHFS